MRRFRNFLCLYHKRGFRPFTRSIIGLFSALCASSGNSYATCNPDRFVVAIDIGHQESNPGSTSARGVPEYKFNKRMALKIRSELFAESFHRAFIINEDGRNISLRERALVANKREADVFLSVHHDSVQPHYLSSWSFQGKKHYYSDRFRGYSLFVSQLNGAPQKSLRLARLLGDQFLSIGVSPTLHHAEPIPGEDHDLLDARRGVYRFDNLKVLNATTMPAVLIEFGVIVHRVEEIRLDDPVYQRSVANAVTNALIAYCAEK